MSTGYNSIFIAGSNRGIGLGLVKEVLKVYPNAKVYATCRSKTNSNELIELANQNDKRLVILQLDMMDDNSIKEAAKELESHTKSIDLAIFNAGIMKGQGSLNNLSSQDFISLLETNVVGPHNLLKAFHPFLLESKNTKRTIALLSSALGSIGLLHMINHHIAAAYNLDYNPTSGYSTSKCALNMLGRQWAEILEPKGVAVSLIHPGSVKTDMNNSEGTISIEESVEGIIKVLNDIKIETTKEGILGYDGKIRPF